MASVGKQMRVGAAQAAAGGALPPQWASRAKDYFAFAVDFLNLGGNATATRSFQVDADADFLLSAITGIGTVVGAPQTIVSPVGVLLEFTMGGSGRLLQSAPIHFENLCGSGELPGYLPYPKLLPRAGAITVRAQNLTATAMDLRLALGGFKIFDFPDTL